jgi:hypothetical protein
MEEPAPRMFWPKVVWSKCVRNAPGGSGVARRSLPLGPAV